MRLYKYSDYLFENAGSYVLAWIIEGARKAIEADFHLERPKVVADAIAEYRGMNDWLGQFLEECCVKGDGLKEKSGELYQEYRSYCLRTGEISRNNADFTAVLEKAGYTRKKKKSGMWVQGLQLKDTDLKGDKQFPHDGDKVTIQEYLEDCGACSGCMDAFEEAWAEYEGERSRTEACKSS